MKKRTLLFSLIALVVSLVTTLTVVVLVSGCGTGGLPPLVTLIAFLSDRTGDLDVWVMDANGANPLNLSNNPPPNAGVGRPTWDPTSPRVAFVMENASGWDLYTINANGTGLTQRTNDATSEGDPDWSPSGTQIAYAKSFDIYIYDLSTNTESPMNLAGSNKNRPKWSPNGAQLVFEWSPTGLDWEVAIVNATGGTITNLSNDPTAPDLTPVWSPASLNQIAWVKGGNILVHNFTTNTQSILTSSGNASSPAFSPNGQYLVYVENGDIYRLTWTGSGWGNLTQLTNTGDNFTPCWTSNSQMIVYMSTQPSGDAEIWRMRFDGTQKVNLTNIGATDEVPVCQP